MFSAELESIKMLESLPISAEKLAEMQREIALDKTLHSAHRSCYEEMAPQQRLSTTGSATIFQLPVRDCRLIWFALSRQCHCAVSYAQ